MSVAVIGAGIQGCCVAIELASRGLRVELFERREMPMLGASRWNEGKIHLGYTYAKGGSATTRVMICGALAFDRFLRRHLGVAAPAVPLSSPFVYGVHRDSQLAPDCVANHFATVDALIAEEVGNRGGDYLGDSETPRSRTIPVDRFFDGGHVVAAFQTSERSVDTHRLADALANRVRAEPRITFRPSSQVEKIERSGRSSFDLHCQGRPRAGGFTHVVNASAESRLITDATLGLHAKRKWLYRFKQILYLRNCKRATGMSSASFVLGPFGDVVSFDGGELYLSWYPSCRVATSDALQPPQHPSSEATSIAGNGHITEPLKQLLPALGEVDVNCSAELGGGWIFAWGHSDIDDINSELHQRDDVGVHTVANYHTINTGKLTLAPLHAVTVSDRIAPLR